MNALILFVVIYMAVTITIGLVAARQVKNSKDYLIAGVCKSFHQAEVGL